MSGWGGARPQSELNLRAVFGPDTNNTGGTFTFSGTSKTFNTATGTALILAGNSDTAAVQFTHWDEFPGLLAPP